MFHKYVYLVEAQTYIIKLFLYHFSWAVIYCTVRKCIEWWVSHSHFVHFEHFTIFSFHISLIVNGIIIDKLCNGESLSVNVSLYTVSILKLSYHFTDDQCLKLKQQRFQWTMKIHFHHSQFWTYWILIWISAYEDITTISCSD